MESAENKRFVYEFGKFLLDPQEKTLFADGVPVHLPAKEFETLLFFVENNGHALSKEEMLAAVWQDAFVEEGNLAKQISRLRKILNTNDQKYIETLPKHGYRFSADVSQIIRTGGEMVLEKRTVKRLTVKVEEDFDETPSPSSPPPALPPAPRKFSNLTLFAVLGLVVAASVFGFWYWNRAETSDAKINSIAVLPLKSLTDEENGKALGLGLTDALITKLGSLRSVVVRPTSAVMKFAETNTDAVEIGRRLNVDAVLEGTIQQAEGRIRINARLLNIKTGEQLWTEKFDEPANEIFALQDTLSNRIVRTLAFGIKTSELEGLATHPTENAEAYEKYLRGRFYQSRNNEQGLLRSIEFYEQAIALDPNFAEPYAGIADAHVILYNFGLRPPDTVIPQVKQNIRRALQLNPDLSDAHLTLAQILFLYERDWQKAEASFQKAVELNPNNANAFLRYGYFLTFLGRFDQALSNLEKARQLNPLSSFVQINIASVYLCQRNYPAAIELLNKIITDDPEISTPHWFLGASYEASGETDKAFTANLRALELEGGTALAKRLDEIKKQNGETAAYREWLDETLKARAKGFVPAIQIAFLSAVLKDSGKTLFWLEKAEAERDATLWAVKYVARYDFLRNDGRFRQLVKKIDSKQP